MGDKGGRKQGLEAGHVQSCEAIRKYGIYGKDRGLVFGFSLFCLCFLWVVRAWSMTETQDVELTK